MAPSPQKNPGREQDASNYSQGVSKPMTGNEVVISGMSGIFPKSDSVKEFMENLYNKVDMVSSENMRWISNHPEVPKHSGQITGMGKFDAQFFRVHYKQACTMEPMSRKLLEHAYSSIYDSGINPLQLRGKKVGVFIGSTFSESEKTVIYENVQRNGFGITGCNKAMYSNRISYWIDGKGPSYSVDLACASSTACLEHAYRSISSGQCEAAIVGGCNLCTHPNVMLQFKRCGFLCMDGKTKCFDKNGDGHVRSDAISVLFLQKAKDAKRIYSEVYFAKSRFTPMPNHQFLATREPNDIQEFLQAFYSEINVSPKDVEYVEANGTAIADADAAEIEAIGNVFAKDKNLKVGCVKSNMGSSEPASGVCSVTKLCLAYHTGKLPGNLHYYEPQEHIPAIRDKRVQILTETVPFNRGLAALNSFSYSGADLHILLKGHYKPKDLERYKSSIPRLVLASGRQELCVNEIFDNLLKNSIDLELIGLLHNIHESDIPGHMCRGYMILETNEKNETCCLAQNIEYASGESRPIWFVYSGMGSQWAGMGAKLMQIPIFAAAIEKCHQVLQPKGIDIVKILTDPDKTVYNNILHSFIGIAAVQIGLTDLLTEMGIKPDSIIGHSVGELGCAYADGCFTAEEMILAAYSRGLVSIQTSFIRGSMAAVGLGYKNIQALCPPEIEVACHNSLDSSTISGPADIMKQFVSDLVSQGIFAKEVQCSNIAYHSKYIANAGPSLLKYLKDVIKVPNLRSNKWVSTSVPQENWGDDAAKYSSAEYHTNNLLNPVLFEETSKCIPRNAILIEIAPHGLLQAILKRSLSECAHIPLARRGHVDPVKFLLENIGKMYQVGLQPKISVLYPRIEYPVSTETPLLSHLVKWEHNEDWLQAKFFKSDRITSLSREIIISLHDDDYKCFSSHIRDGLYVLPEAAFLVLTWETLAMYKGVEYKDLPVIFKDIHFRSEVTFNLETLVRLYININKGNNKFEITYENCEIVNGFITEARPEDFTKHPDEHGEVSHDMVLNANDVYTMMKLRGYNYKEKFQSIHSSNESRTTATIKWNEEWIPFLDGIIQFCAFARDGDSVSVPTLIKKLSINVKEHKATESLIFEDDKCLNAHHYSIYNYSKCGGVQVELISFMDKLMKVEEHDIIQTRKFIPYVMADCSDLKTVLEVCFQIVADNTKRGTINVVELLKNDSINLTDTINKVAREVTMAELNINSTLTDDIYSMNKKLGQVNLIIVDNILGNYEKMEFLYEKLDKNSFLLTLEDDTTQIDTKYKQFNIISVMPAKKQTFVLLNKKSCINNTTYLSVSNNNTFDWVQRLETALEKSQKVILVSERKPYCGLFGLVKKLRHDHGSKLSLILIDDFYYVPSFNPENGIFKEQLQKNLTFNILRKGQWGSYYYLSNTNCSKIENFSLSITEPGNLDNLTWIEAPLKNENENLIQVSYAGISFKDIQLATGMNIKNRKHLFGMDFSGLNSKGDRIMGVVQSGALSSIVVADPYLSWPVPEHWSLEDAASVPLIFVYAYYCMAIKCQLRSGLKIFVQGGAGALGQAIISICLEMDCEVFTSVSDVQKKKFLLKMFPKLKENHVTNSRNPVYQDMVLENTKVWGCDIVVNCSSGALREACMKCASEMSIFLDLSDHDLYKDKEFGMYFLMYDCNYCAVQLSTIFQPKYFADKKKLQTLISEGIAKGIVKPITRVVYSPSDISKAFRLVSTSKHRGKVLIKIRAPDNTPSSKINAVARITFSSNGSYIVVCDNSLLSVELIDRLIKREAKNIILHMNPNSKATYKRVMAWKKWNVTIKTSSENLLTEQGCTNLFNEAKRLGPVFGIFIVQNFGTGNYGKRLYEKQLEFKFNNVALLVANLDHNSRNICNEIRHFVIINYGSNIPADEYVSSVIDEICQSRIDVTLPALVIRLGPILELESREESIISKIRSQSLANVLNTLESCLQLKHDNVMTFNLKKHAAPKFLDKISRIIGVQNIADLNENYTIEDMLVNEFNLQEIINAIKDEYKICYPRKSVLKMTIERIKNLGRDVTVSDIDTNSGLGAFFTYIDEDECSASEHMMIMPTKYSYITEDSELDRKSTCLILIPGFEGHHQIFKSVCERLKMQALAFQLGPDMMDDTIQQMAAKIMKFMVNRFDLKSKFYLLGYSFGVNVALELAALFEKEGKLGVVYCLDSSPDALRAQLDAQIGNLSDTEVQNSLAQHMYHLMTGYNSDELNSDLDKVESWPQKVEACIKRLRGLVSYSHQYKKSILQGAYRKILLAKEYKPSFRLKSRIVLIKGIPHPKALTLAKDYNLSEYTTQPVEVFKIESDHALAPKDCRVPNIINKFLDPSILESFKKKNLCESYLIEPEKAF